MNEVEIYPHIGFTPMMPTFGTKPAVCQRKKLSVQHRRLRPIVDTEGDAGINWRGHGGTHPTCSTVEFDCQMDKIAIWIEEWDHNQKCQVIEGILRRSGHNQVQLLYTVMQPSLHRDFMYAARKQFPDVEFKPLSTHITRRLKSKLERTRQNTFHRVKSAHMQSDDDIKLQMKKQFSVRFPDLRQNNPEHMQNRTLSNSSRVRATTNQVGTFKQSSSLTDWWSQGPEANQTDVRVRNPVHRLVEVSLRRHIQDEASSQMLKGSTTSINTDSSLKSSLHTVRTEPSLRHRTIRHSNLKKSSTHTVKISMLPSEAQTLFQWYTDNWTDVQRNEFLHKFLLKLDPREHYFISSFLSVRKHRDFLALLPEKLALKILGYLTPKELLKVGQVSTLWEQLASSNELWRVKCTEVKLEVPVTTNPIWKKVFRDNMFLRLNWNNGVCRTMELRGHTDKVMCVTFDETRLASGSSDKTVKVWDIKTGELLQTFRGHNKGVWCLAFFTDNLLVSGSYDGTIKVWNITKGNAMRTLLAHDGPIWAMARRDSKLVTVSQDRTAKVWEISRCMLQHTLKGHQAAIFAVDMDEIGKLVFTGSADKTVRMWDSTSGECMKVIWVSPTTSIMSVSYSRGHFVCAYGNTICLYNVETAKLIRAFHEHEKRIESVELRMVSGGKFEGMIVSAGKDGLLKYWDINKNTSLHTFSIYSEGVNCIHFDELRIGTGSQDQLIRILDFNIS
ncbi:hypothetical protein ScPMuIL_012355 [Solemya velum]